MKFISTYTSKIKVLALIIPLFVALPHLQAQGPNNPSLRLNILSGTSIEFNFDSMDDWQNGIQNEGQATYIRVGSLGNWKLEFAANETQFYGTIDPLNQMPLDNLGLMVASSGTNQDDGSNIINYARTAPLALSNSEVLILANGPMGNKGHGIRNSFILNWEIGTTDGNMNPQSILQQLIEADNYIVNITLTLTAVP